MGPSPVTHRQVPSEDGEQHPGLTRMLTFYFILLFIYLFI